MNFKPIILFFLLSTLGAESQSIKEKQINSQTQTWISINSNIPIAKKISILADVHIRRNNFLDDDSFYLVRAGFGYSQNPKSLIAISYAHGWFAPTVDNWHTFSNENRITQQFQYTNKIGNTTFFQRLRNEQRWQQKIVNDQFSGDLKFTNRVRYLVSLTIPVFNKKNAPSLVISDEILVQFGKEIVFNTFDQNRFFIGIKKTVNTNLSFDFGYMNVFQQKSSGYQYDENHTLRLFFYYNPKFTKG